MKMTTAQVVETSAQSLSPTVLFRATLTQTITLNKLIPLGSNHLLSNINVRSRNVKSQIEPPGQTRQVEHLAMT